MYICNICVLGRTTTNFFHFFQHVHSVFFPSTCLLPILSHPHTYGEFRGTDFLLTINSTITYFDVLTSILIIHYFSVDSSSILSFSLLTVTLSQQLAYHISFLQLLHLLFKFYFCNSVYQPIIYVCSSIPSVSLSIRRSTEIIYFM